MIYTQEWYEAHKGDDEAICVVAVPGVVWKTGHPALEGMYLDGEKLPFENPREMRQQHLTVQAFERQFQKPDADRRMGAVPVAEEPSPDVRGVERQPQWTGLEGELRLAEQKVDQHLQGQCGPRLGAALAAIRRALLLIESTPTLVAVEGGKNYLDWASAGGPGECSHGYAAGIPCPDCDAARWLSPEAIAVIAGWDMTKLSNTIPVRLARQLLDAQHTIREYQSMNVELGTELDAFKSPVAVEKMPPRPKSNLSRVDGELPPRTWEFFCDSAYYDMWAVRPIGDTSFTSQELFHVPSRGEAEALAAKFTKLEAQLAAVSAERDMYKGNVAGLEAALKSARTDRHAARERADKRFTQVAELSTSVAIAEARAEAAEAERDEARTQLRTVLEREAKTTARYDTKLETAESALRERTEELERARYAPMGDNHHNALECPYCNPARAPLRERDSRIQELAKLFGVCDGGKYLNDWIARADHYKSLRERGGSVPEERGWNEALDAAAERLLKDGSEDGEGLIDLQDAVDRIRALSLQGEPGKGESEANVAPPQQTAE